MKLFQVLLLVVIGCVCVSTCYCQREITSDQYQDRIKAMWLGQMLGNYAGRQVEGKTYVYYEGPNSVNKLITDYQVQWSAILGGRYYSSSGTLKGDPDCWQGDDDTCLEFLYAWALQNQASLTYPQTSALWTDNIALSGLYVANRQAWHLINDHGQTTSRSGSQQYNIDSVWSIDAQITTESLGAIALGMRQIAADLAVNFGGITNCGYSLDAARFYAAMYAEAVFTGDVEEIVSKAMEVVPQGSWTRLIIEQAMQLYENDKADGLLDDWLASRNSALAFVHDRGRDRTWVESPSNTALTVLAILYGQGDFTDTVEYAVRGGEDSDCNPATAGGLIGMMKGYAEILAELIADGHDIGGLPQMYDNSSTIVISQDCWTLEEIALIFLQAARTQVLSAGGSVIGHGDGVILRLPPAGSGGDRVIITGVQYPSGPSGLIGEILACGGDVGVSVYRNEEVIADNSSIDRTDQGRLIDGVIDLSYSGVLAFDTYNGSSAPRSDTYQLTFDRDVLIKSVVFHEGDIRPYDQGSGLSLDPSLPQYQPLGGYFTDLCVEVMVDDQWVPVNNLQLSEDLEAFKYFQSITMDFNSVTAQAVRIIGNAGGASPYTSATEIEIFGSLNPYLAGDADQNKTVTIRDFLILKSNYGTASGATWEQGDFDGDGDVDLYDFLLLRSNYGHSS